MRHSISTLPVIWSFMKLCVTRSFWVERHLYVVHEVLQVVGSHLVEIGDSHQVRAVIAVKRELVFGLQCPTYPPCLLRKGNYAERVGAGSSRHDPGCCRIQGSLIR